MFTSKSRQGRRSRQFAPTFDALSARIAPTVFVPVDFDMGLPVLPDSGVDSNVIVGGDQPVLPSQS
jgi:hypothetical protein